MEDSDQYHKRREGERLNWIVECPGTFSMCFGVIPFVGESVEYGECGHKKKGKHVTIHTGEFYHQIWL